LPLGAPTFRSIENQKGPLASPVLSSGILAIQNVIRKYYRVGKDALYLKPKEVTAVHRGQQALIRVFKAEIVPQLGVAKSLHHSLPMTGFFVFI
jgi:hypothetical protein